MKLYSPRKRGSWHFDREFHLNTFLSGPDVVTAREFKFIDNS